VYGIELMGWRDADDDAASSITGLKRGRQSLASEYGAKRERQDNRQNAATRQTAAAYMVSCMDGRCPELNHLFYCV
jgi:carbonic anhydrase